MQVNVESVTIEQTQLYVGVGRLRIPAETAGLRAIAIFEVVKAVVVLIVGWGTLAFIHKDLHAFVVDVFHRLHLDPSMKLMAWLLDKAAAAHTSDLFWIAGGATVYASIRIAEAIGLWLDRNWGNWIGALSGGIYLPIEAYEVVVRYTPTRLALLVGNLLIVIFLCHRLQLQHLAAKVAKATGQPVRDVLDRAEGKPVEEPIAVTDQPLA